MALTTRDRQRYSAGERGRNRVRIFRTAKTLMIQMEWRENGRRLTRSLRHDDWEKAKRQADEFAANYAGRRQLIGNLSRTLALGISGKLEQPSRHRWALSEFHQIFRDRFP